VAKEIKQINDTTSDLPEGFKMTELGPLPEEWEVVRLGEVVKTTKGKRPKDLLSKFSSKTIPYLTADFFRTGVASKYVSLEKKDYVEVGKDDIIFIWDGSNAGDVFLGVEGALASTMIKIEPLINVDKRFLFFFLKTKFELFNSTTTGTTIPHVNKNIFENLLIPLPFLSEQKAIAHVLQTVQRAKEATEKVIQATQELKKSLMRHLFTYGPVPIDEVDKVQLKETEIGLVPEHWEVVRLGELANIRYGKAKPKTSGSIPVIGSGGIYAWTDQALVDFPTLIIGRKGTAGQVWLVRGSCWPSDTTFYLEWHIPDCRAIADFLYCVFLLNPLSGEHAKTTLPSLQRHDLENYLIPLPPIHEQQEIAHILQAVDQKIEAEKAKKQALETLFQSLLHNLMTGKLCVKDIILPKTKEMI
jgi:type I restriction enzyme S subunit